jgi:hypothetical protein
VVCNELGYLHRGCDELFMYIIIYNVLQSSRRRTPSL